MIVNWWDFSCKYWSEKNSNKTLYICKDDWDWPNSSLRGITKDKIVYINSQSSDEIDHCNSWLLKIKCLLGGK